MLIVKVGFALLSIGTALTIPLIAFSDSEITPLQKIFKADTGIEENCRAVKLPDSVSQQNLRLWVCSFPNEPLTPVFYFFNNGRDNKNTQLTGPYLTHKVSKIELKKNNARGKVSQVEGNYDLNVLLDNGTNSWTWLIIQDGTNRKLPKKDTVNTVFLVKHSITELKPENCKLEIKNLKLETMRCSGKKYSFENDKKGFF